MTNQERGERNGQIVPTGSPMVTHAAQIFISSALIQVVASQLDTADRPCWLEINTTISTPILFQRHQRQRSQRRSTPSARTTVYGYSSHANVCCSEGEKTPKQNSALAPLSWNCTQPFIPPGPRTNIYPTIPTQPRLQCHLGAPDLQISFRLVLSAPQVVSDHFWTNTYLTSLLVP